MVGMDALVVPTPWANERRLELRAKLVYQEAMGAGENAREGQAVSADDNNKLKVSLRRYERMIKFSNDPDSNLVILLTTTLSLCHRRLPLAHSSTHLLTLILHLHKSLSSYHPLGCLPTTSSDGSTPVCLRCHCDILCFCCLQVHDHHSLTQHQLALRHFQDVRLRKRHR